MDLSAGVGDVAVVCEGVDQGTGTSEVGWVEGKGRILLVVTLLVLRVGMDG